MRWLPPVLAVLAACGTTPPEPAPLPPAAVEAPSLPTTAPPAAPAEPAAVVAPTPAASTPAAAPTPTVPTPTTKAAPPPKAAPEKVAVAAAPAPVAQPVPAPSPAVAETTPAAPEPPSAHPVAYTLTPTANALYVVVRHDPDTVMASMGHDHAIGATGWHGSVTWSSDGDPAGCAVDLVVPVSGLRVDPDGLRTRAGLGGEGETSDGDKAKIRENLSGDRQLDGARFPELRFVGRSCTRKGDAVAVSGDLTLHGVTRPLTVTLDVDADATAFHARGTWKVKGTDFGIEPFKVMGGAIRNLDTLSFALDVRGKPAG